MTGAAPPSGVCTVCEATGGPPPRPLLLAEFRVSIVAPPGPAAANETLDVCGEHASVLASAYLGYGWAFHADLIDPSVEALVREAP